jgi:hypothetical protein
MAFAPAAQFPAPHTWTAIMIDSDLPSASIAESAKHLLASKHPEMIVNCRSFEAAV